MWVFLPLKGEIEFHRDSKRAIEENCKVCGWLDDENAPCCDGIPILLGEDLKNAGYDADPNKFYLYKDCPWKKPKEDEE